jgi:hypothetical protein
MQNTIDDFESEDPEPEDSVADLCAVPPAKRKVNKITETIVGNFMDQVKRDNARKTAANQDLERRPVVGTRYDVNSYAGGPVTILDLCVVEERKVR